MVMPKLPRWVWFIAVALAAAYCVAFGALSLAWRQNGVDLAIFHEAGAAVRRGLDPYTPGQLAGPFAYPPNGIPLCVLISLLPWPVALALWKVANLAFLVGAVVLSMRLFAQPPLRFEQRMAVWVFSLLLWPTISALFTGNTPLFVLLCACAALFLMHAGWELAGGVCLGLALIKPPLLLPLCAFLVYRRQWRVLAAAGCTAGALWLVGTYLSGATLHGYLAALSHYSAGNLAGDVSTMGLPNLLGVAGGLSSFRARQIAVWCGAAMVGLAILLDRGKAPQAAGSPATLPLVLLLGIGFFGARTYDLVFVIPAFVWFLSAVPTHGRLAWWAIVLSLPLTIPQQAVQLVYHRYLATLISPALFAVLVTPFRSWLLLLLILLAVLLSLPARRGRRPAEIGRTVDPLVMTGRQSR